MMELLVVLFVMGILVVVGDFTAGFLLRFEWTDPKPEPTYSPMEAFLNPSILLGDDV